MIKGASKLCVKIEIGSFQLFNIFQHILKLKYSNFNYLIYFNIY